MWLGGYLFTTFVVSPALRSLPIHEAERVQTRSVVGRRYGRLAGPLLLVWLVVLLFQALTVWTLLRLALLLILAAAVGVHGYVIGSRLQRLAERELRGQAVAGERTQLQRLSSRLTPVALITSLLLAIGALL